MTTKDKLIGISLILIGIAFIALGVMVEMPTVIPQNNQVYTEQKNSVNVYMEQNNTNNNMQTDEEGSTRYIY